jgi:hypothetical protein
LEAREIAIKEDKTHTSQKSIHNYIGTIKTALILGTPRRTAERVF